MTMFFKKSLAREWRITTLDTDSQPTKRFVRIGNKKIMVLGSDENCDIRIQDDSIAEKHCILCVVNDKVWVKPLADSYSNGELLAANTEFLWRAEHQLQLGERVFKLTSGTTNWIKGSAVVGVFLVMASGWWILQQQVSGVIAATESNPIPVGKSQVNQTSYTYDMERVAADVEEVFRLSGYRVEAAPIAQGEVSVEAKGYTEKEIKKLIYSPAMLAVNGLKKVHLEMLVTAQTPSIEGVLYAVKGNDNYLVGYDGSRYYQGAKLPSGAKLISLLGDQIVTLNNGREHRTPLSQMTIVNPAAKSLRTECELAWACDKSPATVSVYDHQISEASLRFGISESIIRAVIDVESSFNPAAISSAGAIGLMQLMPATAERFGVDDPYDPGQNILGGVKYLRFLMDRYSNNLSKVFAAYNAGEGAVDKYLGVPPYQETVEYVAKVKHALQVIEQI